MRRVHIGQIVFGVVLMTIYGCAGEGPIVPPPPVPAEYADKHMPEGWWTDPEVLAEGKEIYEGKFDIDINCSSCHGRDGKPKKRGSRDFRVAERMNLYSDSALFWRLSEGVPKTKMKPWKKKLTEEQRWKTIAHIRQFWNEGKPGPLNVVKQPPAPKAS